jgi:hypothetical protein
MNRELSAEDRIVLERLLARFVDRLHGAVDFWPLVCLGRLGSDPRGFLLHHSEVVKALVVVIKDLLAGMAQGNLEMVWNLLSRMAGDTRKLQESILVLEQFQSLPLEEVRVATMGVADAYNDLRDAIPRLGDALGVPVSCWQDREAYYQGILHRLFDLFRHERASRPTEVSTPS